MRLSRTLPDCPCNRCIHARSAHERDSYLMAIFARLNLSPRGRLMLLSGLAGFQRNVTED